MRSSTSLRITIFGLAGLFALGAFAPRCAPAAAATQPSMHDTTLVHIGSPSGLVNAFVAWPRTRSATPGIIVVHEWWGLNAQIRQVAERLAAAGYVAIVPDLYHGHVTEDPEKAHELVRGLDMTEAVHTLDSAAAWMRSQPRIGRRRIGVMGFCMGGDVALQYALHSPEPSAVVMFYGGPELDANKLRNLKAALQGHFGADDQGIPVAKVRTFEKALRALGRRPEIYVYPGAGHAFMHEGRSSYRPAAARTAWARALGFLSKRLR